MSNRVARQGHCLLLGLCLLFCLAACGGGSSAVLAGNTTAAGGGSGSNSSSSGGSNISTVIAGSNVVPVSVNSPDYPDGVFVTVKICVPGSSNCVTVNNVLVDTGSVGLRLTADALGSLPASLPAVSGNGLNYAECAPFVSTKTWGSLRTADIYIGGEEAPGTSFQLIGDPNVSVPEGCTNVSDTSAAFNNAHGLLGIGSTAQDCGSGCVSNLHNGAYYQCTPLLASSCVLAKAPISAQVTNPIVRFASDDNGSVLVLPAVPAGGAASVTGSLVFGIDTRSNNSLGSAVPIFLDSIGNFTASYRGVAYGGSYMDSGTNSIVVPDPSIPACNTDATFSYACPGSTQYLQATLTGTSSNIGVVANFSIANADQLLAGTNSAFSNLGDSGGSMVVLGSPFLFGNSVFTSIEGQSVGVYGTAAFQAYY